MDLRSPLAEPNPEVDRAIKAARLIGFGCWAIGWAILAGGWITGSWAFDAAFAFWYLALAGITLWSAALPRKRQGIADKAWTAKFHELAIRDELTGLYNRRYFTSELNRLIANSRRDGTPLTIALIDLNDFKSINDSFGHAAGDLALRLAGESIAAAAGLSAVVARTGGDEFAVILPGCTLAEGNVMADALRVALESSSFAFNSSQGGQGRIRAAVGLATLNGLGEAEQLLHEADNSLYDTKAKMGRIYNRRRAS